MVSQELYRPSSISFSPEERFKIELNRENNKMMLIISHITSVSDPNTEVPDCTPSSASQDLMEHPDRLTEGWKVEDKAKAGGNTGGPRDMAFSFGSHPLKTYLPEGDIDLTAFCSKNMEGDLAINVHAFLEGEEKNHSAEFEVRGVQLINAEVKLIKCKIDDISVDISFNQLGGICKLCFLEKVDRLIGKDHLFKRSVILIKAWCYYESHLLGAHYGLMSSYALETLVLYIFQFFHSSLSGPLAVLHKFLQYFSKFDWESYCISLGGPVHISSLPGKMVEKPENDGDALLLSHENLKDFVASFSVPQRVAETNSFSLKYLNIIDPLKENNNLGRSITEANFYRIRGAFSQGARELDRILSLSEERIAVGICKHFSRLLRIHGCSDVQNRISSVPMAGNASLNAEVGTSLGFREIPLSLLDLTGDYEAHSESMLRARSYCDDALHRPLLQVHPPHPSQFVYNQSPLTLISSLQSEQNVFGIPHVSSNNIVFRSPRYPVNFPSISGVAFSGKEIQPRRGLGTFFPRTVGQSCVRSSPSHSGDHLIPTQNIELGTLGNLPAAAPLLEVSGFRDGTSHDLPPAMKKLTLETSVSSESVSEQSYHIGDENDFPPLPTHKR